MGRRSRWIGVGWFLAASAVALSAPPLWAQSVDVNIGELKRELRQAQEVLKSQQAVIEALQKRVADLEAVQARAVVPGSSESAPMEASASSRDAAPAPF